MAANGPLEVGPPREQATTPPPGAAGYQYAFLSIVAAIVIVFIVFPGAALGVFYPPCVYKFPQPQTATPVPTQNASPATAGTSQASPLAAATPGTQVLVAATAEARQLFIEARGGLQDDAANFAVYTHCLATFNGFIDYGVKFLAIAAAVITTISSTQGWRAIGFTSGALVTALTAYQTTFPLESRASFFQDVAAKVDTVVAEVSYSVADETQLKQLRMNFDQIKLNAAAGPNVRAAATQSPVPSVTISGTPPTATPGGTPTIVPATNLLAPTPTPTLLPTPPPSLTPVPAPSSTPAP
jgi:hypothetical protein